ncbi:MAG: hypothetical protein IPO83_18005 [Chitinophagaceae bacterium]|nr:hypothetical protein [Chitinophagaceae bacterium]
MPSVLTDGKKSIHPNINPIQYNFNNTESNTISSYSVSNGGQLTLLQAVAATTAASPIDVVVAGPEEQYVIELSAEGHTIGSFSRNNDGSLTMVAEMPDVTSSCAGLATF